jgi:hypothetical protein
MFVKAKQLRARGQRRSHQEIAADDGKVGELTLAMVGHTYQLNLNDPASSVHAPLLPVLYEAALITMGGERMMFKGVEQPQGEAGPAYVQEWSVQLIPRALSSTGASPG